MRKAIALLGDIGAFVHHHRMDLMNRWLVQQGRPMGSMNPVESLCFIGSRALGALEFEPTTFLGKRQGIDREDALVLVKTAGVKKARAIIDEVVAVVQQWPAFAEGQRVDVAKLEAIGRTLRLDLA